jgi:predicted transcriptional regulator
MKPYEEIILSYIHKYHEINLEQLQYEIGLNISLISDILRNLYEREYCI